MVTIIIPGWLVVVALGAMAITILLQVVQIRCNMALMDEKCRRGRAIAMARAQHGDIFESAEPDLQERMIAASEVAS